MSPKEAKKRAEAAKAPAAFPGGKAAPAPGELRIAVDKVPYAEIVGHAVLEPDVEVCGVLVGKVGEDEHGPFVHVRHAIRGQSARQEGAAVTFTHETWNHIHQEMDQKFPDEQIVGWYHTHGGFGVFLSEMDTFVHQNFFPEPHHLAYVYDPLAGSEGFFVRRGEKLEPVERYWLGGRERRPAMRMPEPEPASAAPGVRAGGAGGGTDAVAVELRKIALALMEFSARERSGPEGSWTTFLPWLVAAALAALLFLGPRGEDAQERRPVRAAPLLVLERDPATGLAYGVPVELAQQLGDGSWVDQHGDVRAGVDRDATTPLQQQLQAVAQRELQDRLLAIQKAGAARAEQGALFKWAALGLVGLAGLAALAAAAWYFLLRRS